MPRRVRRSQRPRSGGGGERGFGIRRVREASASVGTAIAAPEWVDRSVWAGVTILLAIAVHHSLRRPVRRWSSEPSEATADLRRLRRKETAAAFLMAAIRYLIVMVVAFALIGIFRSDRGYRTYNIELLSYDPDRVEQAVALVASYAPDGEARFLRPPHVVARQELEHELWLVRVHATVPPTLEWLAEQYLVEAIARQAGDALVGEPVAYTLDSAALRRYQARLVVR